MRSLFLLPALLPASVLLAASAGAQELPYPRVDDTAAISTVQVTAPPKTVRIQSTRPE